MGLARGLKALLSGSDPELEDVRAMHKRFGFMNHGQDPGHLSPQKMEERIAMMQEELDEIKEAARDNDLAGMFDGLVDLVVFAKGTAVMMGLPWRAGWLEVTRANMAKVPGVGKRGHKVDLVKPPGWQAPAMDTVLGSYGYLAEEWFDEDGTLVLSYARDDQDRDEEKVA